MLKSFGIFWLFGFIQLAHADDVACLDTTFKFFSPNDTVCIYAFNDPKINGVTCHISQAKKGGWGSMIGLGEDPSNFSIACQQTGIISVDSTLPEQESVFSEKTSVFFKSTKVVRLVDRQHNALVYLAISKRVLEGSPSNSISTIPITTIYH
jgi:CreA protein